MHSIRLLYAQVAPVFSLVLLILLIACLVFLLLALRRVKRIETRFNRLMDNVSEENVAGMLVEYLGTVRTTAAAVQSMQSEHDRIAQIVPRAIRHVGLIRFSPFHDTGGDQSFALALLDGNRDGVIVTALHSRSESRLYAKPVEGGRSTYTLTPEEREAMDRALGQVAVQASS